MDQTLLDFNESALNSACTNDSPGWCGKIRSITKNNEDFI